MFLSSKRLQQTKSENYSRQKMSRMFFHTKNRQKHKILNNLNFCFLFPKTFLVANIPTKLVVDKV